MKKKEDINKRKSYDIEIPNYVSYICTYYKENDKSSYCRLTISVTDLKEDKVVFYKEYWKENYNLKITDLINKALQDAKDYNAVSIIGIKSLPLENFKFGENYLFACILKEQFIDIISK